MSRFRKFIRLPSARRVLLAEAILWLVLAECVTRVISAARLAALLGRYGAHAADVPASESACIAREVSWAIAAAVRHLPWRPVCLPQALAARWLLHRRRVRSTLYLGIAPGEPRAAHAWLCAGPVIITGADEMSGCSVVATFA